jgi:hypothetical protein
MTTLNSMTPRTFLDNVTEFLSKKFLQKKSPKNFLLFCQRYPSALNKLKKLKKLNKLNKLIYMIVNVSIK